MDEAPARSRRRWPWFAILVLGLGAAGGYYAWHADARVRASVARVLPSFLQPGKGAAGTKAAGADPAKAAPAAVPVTVATAETGDFPVVLVGLGTVEANNTVLVRSRVDGQINKINFDEGQVVKKGDVLALIDPRPYRAALEQAQAKKAQDQANLNNVQRDLGRIQSLAKSNFATTQQVDTQTSQAAQLTAQIAADQAAVDNAQTQLDYTTITAPLTGRVGFRLTDQGNIVNAAGTTGIVEIAQLQPIAVIFTEPENALPQLQAGLKAGTVPVAAYSSDGKTLLEEGRLDTFNNTVDASSGTIRLKALFDNTDNRLWPGLSVTTRTTVAIRHDVVIVPDTAVQRGQKGFYAYVVGADNTVQARALKLGMISDARALIEDGINAGERVVVAGQYRLKPGVPVTVGPANPKTASSEP